MAEQPHIIRGGPVRARDLRSAIRELGFEPGIVNTLERLLDEFAQHRQQQRELTELVNQCVTELEKFLQIGDGLRREIERIKKTRDQTDEVSHGPS